MTQQTQPPGPRVVSADDLCVAVESVLQAQVPGMVELLGKTDLGPITGWQQLPDLRAIVIAELPTVGIMSSGLVGPPTYHRSTGWTATWRVNVGTYDRGQSHHDTAARARNWAAVIRAVLIRSRTLGGVAQSVTWRTEDYALYPQQEVARTFGASVVGVDITAVNVHDLSNLDPQVTATRASLDVRP